MKRLGLLGGVSWVSTLDYYRYINEGINERLGGLNFAECIIYSLTFDDVQRHGWDDWDEAFRLVSDACRRLKAAGAEAIALCANTAHTIADRVEADVQLPLIHIATATANEVGRRGLRKVGLLGTRFTMELPFYMEKLREHGIEAFVPPEQAVRDFIQHTVKEELGRGLVRQETKAAYVEIANQLIAKGGRRDRACLHRNSPAAEPAGSCRSGVRYRQNSRAGGRGLRGGWERPTMNRFMRATRLLWMALLAGSAGAGCGLFEPDTERRPGYIGNGDISGLNVVEGPSAVTAGVATAFTINTFGSSSCLDADGADVVLQGNVAEVTPYDRVPTARNPVCTADFGEHPHPVSLTFPAPGTGTIRVLGLGTEGRSTDTVTATVTVVP